MRVFILGFFWLIWMVTPGLACMSPEFEDHHYPSCTIAPPGGDMWVSVVFADGPAALSGFHLGSAGRQTRVIKVEIAATDKRHYIVLSATGQTIWQFEGAVETVAQVIVLGASGLGPDAAGVTGVPRDLVQFTPPDMEIRGTILQTSCTRIFYACMAAQWFGDAPSDQVTFHPAPSQPRMHADAFVSLGSSLRARAEGRLEIVSIRPPTLPGKIAPIDPALIVSPNPAQPYPLLPGQPGVDALVASGALVPRGTPLHRRLTGSYAAAFSERFQSRFDPDYLYTPPVDYIVTRAVTLPPQMPNAALMVARGVPAPDMNQNSYNICLFFEGQADVPITHWDHQSPLCRQNPGPFSRADGDVFRAAQAFDTETAGQDGCRIMDLPEQTHMAVIALSEGRNRRYRDDAIRQIDIDVTRTGPVALYVSMQGGPVRWNVTGEGIAADIAAVFTRQGPDYGMHKVVVNGKDFSQTRLSKDAEGCPRFAPLYPNRLGPEIAHLDVMLHSLLGHGIDQLIRYKEAGEAWRAPDAVAPIYVIE